MPAAISLNGAQRRVCDEAGVLMSNSLREKATLPRSILEAVVRQSYFPFFYTRWMCADTFEGAPTAELLKKGERVGDAVSRYQHG